MLFIEFKQAVYAIALFSLPENGLLHTRFRKASFPSKNIMAEFLFVDVVCCSYLIFRLPHTFFLRT